MKRKRIWAFGLAALLLTQSSFAVLAEELPIEEVMLEEIPEVEIESIEETVEESVPEEVVDEEAQSAEVVGNLADRIEKAYFEIQEITISKAESWGYQAAKVTWSSVNHADGYRLYAKPEGGKWKFIKETPETSYVHNGLTTGKKYTYYVRAFQMIAGEKVWTDYSEGKSVTPIPKKTTITKIQDQIKGAKLTWTKSNGASGYRIYYRLSGTKEWTYVTQVKGGSTLTYTHKNLKAGKSYDYIMRAYRTVNGKPVFSKYSKVVSVTVPVSKMYELEEDVAYYDYDVTGDGIPDEFFYVYEPTFEEGWLYVNGYCKGTVYMGRGGSIYLCSYTSSQVYLINQFGQLGGNGLEAYRYIDGEFRTVNDCDYFGNRTFEISSPWKVYDEWLYVKSQVYRTWHLETFNQAEKPPVVNSRFKLKDGKYILAARTLTVVENTTYKAVNSFTTSTSRTSIDHRGPKVSKGQKVIVKKIYLPADYGAPYYQVSVNGKTGWFKDSQNRLLTEF